MASKLNPGETESQENSFERLDLGVQRIPSLEK
jgi:hypothetical protein